jgi:hypothetical protein
MSSTLLTKASKGKGPATTDDAEDIAPPPVPTSKSRRSKKQPVDKSTAVPNIPSGSIVVDEGTPVRPTVEGANDQSDRDSQLPSDLEAARLEIAALRAVNEELRRSATPKKRGRPNRKKGRSNLRRRRTSDPSDPSSSPSGTQISDRSDWSYRRSRSPRRSYKIEDPDKLNNGIDPTFNQWKDLMDGKMYQNRD